MRSVAEALQTVLENCVLGPEEQVTLTEALHRTLAVDQLATSDSPPFDKALMDGFAVRAPSGGVAASVSSQTVQLQVLQTITAGMVPTVSVSETACARIMTGAPLPDGCNCVVPIEQTGFDEGQPGTVTIPAGSFRDGANLVRRGAVARTGSLLLKAGTLLQPQHIAALAEFGIARVGVRKPPVVAVLATGDELVPFDQTPPPGGLRNSNEPMLLAQAAACHASPVSLGIAPDRAEPLRGLIERGLKHDVLLLSGGVSAGLLDLVPSQLQRAGVRPVFHGVNMKPGKPLWFGVKESEGHRCLVFGLPGNPVSSLTCFELFVRPAINVCLGRSAAGSPMQAELTAEVRVSGSRPVYHPARLGLRNGRMTAAVVPWSGSSDLAATTQANGMVLLLAEHGPYRAGERVDAFAWEPAG